MLISTRKGFLRSVPEETKPQIQSHAPDIKDAKEMLHWRRRHGTVKQAQVYGRYRKVRQRRRQRQAAGVCMLQQACGRHVWRRCAAACS